MDAFDDISETHASPPAPRPYIGVLFECCGVYQRVYRKPEAREYRGRCPRCLRVVTVRVGPGGSSQRIFTAR